MEYEGYIRLAAAIPAVALAGLFIRIKFEGAETDDYADFTHLAQNNYVDLTRFESINRPSTWNLRSAAQFISTLQSRARQAAVLACVIAIAVFAIVMYCQVVWRYSYWPTLSLASAETGWQVLAILFVNAVKIIACIVALIAFAFPFFLIGILGAVCITPMVYYFLVYGTVLHILFIINWIMTGHYFAGILEPPWAKLALTLTFTNLLLSDLGDVFVFVVDLTLSASENT